MATLEQVDLRTVPNNLNREDLMQQIVDISQIPLPFMSRIGRSSHTNPFFEWPADKLADPDTSNAVIDGSSSTTPDSDPALRLGNHSQISQKTVGTSTRVEASSNAGNEGLARQVAKKTQELQRDMEAILLLNNANVADTGTGGVAGETAGLEAWLDVNDITDTLSSPLKIADASGELDLGTNGDIGGWTQRSGQIIPAIDYTSLTTPAALTFSDVKDVLDALYQLGNNPTVLMARASIIRLLSSFMFTSSAQISTPIRDDNSMGPASAQSAVNKMISDYGVIVDFVPNRLMQQSGDGSPACDTLFAFDPEYISVSYMGGGIRSKELPADGLFRKVQLHADYGLCVKNPDSLGGIIGIDDSAAVTA